MDTAIQKRIPMMKRRQTHTKLRIRPEVKVPNLVDGLSCICWTFKRKNLAPENRKVMVTGYESTVGDIRCCLESFGKQSIREMNKYIFGHYMKLLNTVTRSGKVLHYMISRQVTPRPELDKTALWFKFKGKVLRFSRVEFVLISGLKFGPAKINPYMMNDMIQVDYVYAQLLDSTPILPVLMASMYVVGLDPNKTKILNWIWVLVEDNEAWEQFSWGSMSYQLLIGQINAVKICIPGPYRLKGNTIAFFIYEVIPSIGVKFGGRMEQEKRPRMLRYRYSTASDFSEYPSKLINALEPSERELNTDYWKSLEVVPLLQPSTLSCPSKHTGRSKYGGPDKRNWGLCRRDSCKKSNNRGGGPSTNSRREDDCSSRGYVVGRLAAMERTLAAVPQAMARPAMEQPTTSVAEATEGEENPDGITIPTIEKAAGQEMTQFETMLDPSGTQINAIYDDLVCLVKVTPPTQGILPGAMIAMYDDIMPSAQSILPCAVGSPRHAPIMAAPLRTPAALAIPKVILNVRPVRRRFPAAAGRSPFLHDDIRGGDTFDHYLRLEDGGI
ncbi:hypothetical protein OROMI_026396 [Orobanche minor]